MGLPNDFPNHVRCINHGDRAEHVSRQGENGHLMVCEIGGEGGNCTEVRCMEYGTYHVMSLWAFGGNKAAG